MEKIFSRVVLCMLLFYFAAASIRDRKMEVAHVCAGKAALRNCTKERCQGRCEIYFAIGHEKVVGSCLDNDNCKCEWLCFDPRPPKGRLV
ncbi:hypothetical protein ACS0TY_020462 [Phlomoides rotata]